MIILSIITVNLNNATGLKKTIESIKCQNFKDFEFLIIDGGSTDGSIDIIKNNENLINYWVSERDAGIYHAMNKGIQKAKGRYLLMLNSGDWLTNKTTLKGLKLKNHHEDIIYGNNIWVEDANTYKSNYPRILTYSYLKQNSICHQASFIKRELHDRVGPYNQHYRITSDWEFFLLAIAKFKVSQKFVREKISICNRQGLSCRPESWQTIIEERNDILQKHFNESYIGSLKAAPLKRPIKKLKAKIKISLSSIIPHLKK